MSFEGTISQYIANHIERQRKEAWNNAMDCIADDCEVRALDKAKSNLPKQMASTYTVEKLWELRENNELDPICTELLVVADLARARKYVLEG